LLSIPNVSNQLGLNDELLLQLPYFASFIT
jgi:hypothetical protein